MGDTKKTSGSRNNRYRLRAVRLVRGEERHFHPTTKIRFIGGFGERVQKVVQGVVIVICESSRYSTGASHFLLPEESETRTADVVVPVGHSTH
jgi:hypothetical protein